MNYKKGKLLAVFAVASFAGALFFAERAKAAVFSFATDDQTTVGGVFTLTASIDTERQILNAVGGEIVFPDDLLAVQSVNDGNSMLNFWIEKPHLKNNRIIFSGIIPGGYYGDEARLFDIVFNAKKSGSGEVAFGQATALLNDGSGTAAPVATSPWSFVVAPPAALPEALPLARPDLDPPESFVPEISSTPDVFDGAYFLAFLTQDKGSGIDHYEVKETRISGFAGLTPWINAVSPYLLKDQELKSHIWVKAVDKAGNARIAELSPPHPPAWYEISPLWSMIILLAAIVIIFIAWRTIVHRKK